LKLTKTIKIMSFKKSDYFTLVQQSSALAARPAR
jgi:hypothetical protein